METTIEVGISYKEQAKNHLLQALDYAVNGFTFAVHNHLVSASEYALKAGINLRYETKEIWRIALSADNYLHDDVCG